MTDLYSFFTSLNPYALFTGLLNRSIAAAVIIALIVLIRLVLKNKPRKYICLLWAVAALSLIVPIRISSPISAWGLFNKSGVELHNALEYSETFELPEAVLTVDVDPSASDTESSIVSVVQPTDGAKAASDHRLYLPTLIIIWAAGFAAMIAYMFFTYVKIRHQVAVSVPYNGADVTSGHRAAVIRICDSVPSPFILGIIKPVIYVPSVIAEVSDNYDSVNFDNSPIFHVAAHEMAHIRHLDHWWKLIGFVLLAVNWFNPLVWLGYILFGRDMEARCDENVIESMDTASRKLYSKTLLECSSGSFSAFVCPLAFCENNTGGRVKSILNYKKPGVMITVIMIACCIVFGVVFLTSPSAAGLNTGDREEANQQTFGERMSLVPQRHYVCFETGGVNPLHISLYKNGSFDFTDGTKTVYDGVGTWEQNDLILTLTEDETLSGRSAVNRFRVESTGMTFIAEGSEGFPGMDLKNGTRFDSPLEQNKDGSVPTYSKARFEEEMDPEICPRCRVGVFAGRGYGDSFSTNVKDTFGLTEHCIYLRKECDNLACRYAEDVKQIIGYSCYSIDEKDAEAMAPYLYEKYGVDMVITSAVQLENGIKVASGAQIAVSYSNYTMYYLTIEEYCDGEFTPSDPGSLWLLLRHEERGPLEVVGDIDGPINLGISVEEIVHLITSEGKQL